MTPCFLLQQILTLQDQQGNKNHQSQLHLRRKIIYIQLTGMVLFHIAETPTLQKTGAV